MKNREVIKGIQYLRGAAALMVVFFHFRFYLNDIYAQKNLGDILFGSGAFGVDLFFIISGFIICYSTRKHENHPVVAYALKRFFRIYPLLLACLLAFYVLFGADGFSLLRSMVPLQANYAGKGPFFGYNMLDTAWTLTYEISFYLVFLVGLALSHKHRRLIVGFLIVLSFVLMQAWLNQGIDMSAYSSYAYPGGPLLRPVVAILSSPMILEFVFGMVLYSVCMKVPDIPQKAKLFLNPVLLGLMAISVLVYFSGNFYGHGPTRWGMPSAVLILSLVLYERLNGLPNIRWLFFLGNISYSLYLTHIIVINLINNYHANFGLKGFPAFAFAVAVSLVSATLVHYLVEVKAIAVCRQLLRRMEKSGQRALPVRVSSPSLATLSSVEFRKRYFLEHKAAV